MVLRTSLEGDVNTLAQPKLRTWSALSDLKRIPTEYEVVTHRLHYNTEMPFELDSRAPVVAWYRRYRDEIALQDIPWNDYREPREMVYRKYTESQDARENFIDVLYEKTDKITADPGWLRWLAEFWGPQRYLGQGLQMISSYEAQMAPSSYVTNCLIFEAGDEMRRSQRIAYHLAVLRQEFPNLSWAEGDRKAWEQNAEWRLVRELTESLLVTYPWDEAWVALTLVVKPLIDRVLLLNLGTLARINEDDLVGEITSNLYLDTLRHQEWAQSLSRFIVEHNPAYRDVLVAYMNRWMKRTMQAIEGLYPLFAAAPKRLNWDMVIHDVESVQQEMVERASLSGAASV